MSSIAPGVSTLAFWVAQAILDGKEVPKDLTVPFLKIEQGDLENAKLGTIRCYLEAVGGSMLLEYVMGDDRVRVA